MKNATMPNTGFLPFSLLPDVKNILPPVFLYSNTERNPADPDSFSVAFYFFSLIKTIKNPGLLHRKRFSRNISRFYNDFIFLLAAKLIHQGFSHNFPDLFRIG